MVISSANVVLMPLSFAGNTFVEPATMPGRLRAFVEVTPLSHVTTAALAAVCGPLVLFLYGRRG